MERRGHVELGRGMRHVCDLSGTSNGRVPPMSGGEQTGRLCCCLGRVQPLLPQLLHVSLGEAEQPLPALPTRLGGAENRQMRTEPAGSSQPFSCAAFLLTFTFPVVAAWKEGNKNVHRSAAVRIRSLGEGRMIIYSV